jgi:hypothetical protein
MNPPTIFSRQRKAKEKTNKSTANDNTFGPKTFLHEQSKKSDKFPFCCHNLIEWLRQRQTNMKDMEMLFHSDGMNHVTGDLWSKQNVLFAFYLRALLSFLPLMILHKSNNIKWHTKGTARNDNQ